ncbi:type I methionyl aminopeptidase [Sporanaerobium hydrogeniformans]|uniref:Type I methionyl aminopeptidase n=1 Tax=Sporanaerobium hydrogeniformans TaxID=3072179 RepID=A0AC61DE55_9FIRM|nr:methionyl aminopeptidase [Sporanaerobium hydrogeniformans]PHV70927.1 type I methionyl aminopeptidase [Sporanaerobium hydrogeniformans]
MSDNRNEKCWCGSGLKYKKCHLAFDEKLKALEHQGYEVPERHLIKTEVDIAGIKRSAIVNEGALDLVASRIKAGMSTEEVNQLVHHYTIEQGGIPAPLHYNGYPKSTCVSINNVVCHGIPSEDIILAEGDIVNVDVTTIVDGYFADASRTFMIGEVSERAKKLVEVAKECMEMGIAAIKPWGFLGDIGAVVEEHALKNGYSVVTDLGGHGIGKAFHEEPFVPHVGERGTGMVLVPGMVFTVEPMINEGDYEVYFDEEDGWTVYTEDDSLSAQWECTVLVTETGVEILAK